MDLHTKELRSKKFGLQNSGVRVLASVKKPLDKVKPSSSILAAKKIARLKNKKQPEVIIKDFYQTATMSIIQARDAKEMIRGQTGLVYEKQMVQHLCLWDSNYPECPERFSSILRRCEELGLISRCKTILPREASIQELLEKHSIQQVEILKNTDNEANEEYLEKLSSKYDAIYIHPTTYRLSLLAAGSTIELVDAICTGNVQNGMAIIRPPGHHAMKSEYCGYCFFNNVAVAASLCLKNHNISRILIVDWDVHHGQATQQMFYDDPRVVYISIHRYENGAFWPNLQESDYHYIGEGKGAGFNFNVPLNKIGMGDSDYLAIFHQIILPVALEFQPELVIVSAGYDAAIGCPEGEMSVTPACYAHLLSCLLSLANGRVAVVLEGGYCLKSLAEGAALTLRCLLGDPCPSLIGIGAPCDSVTTTILNVIYSHRNYWQCFQFQDTFSSDTKNINLSNKIAHHHPVVTYVGSEDRPEFYSTRNCYPVQSLEFRNSVDAQLNELIMNTTLTFAPNRVCLIYDELMMKHKNTGDPSHPEKPERISSIYFKHEEYGLVDRCLCIESRRISENELLSLHSKEHIEMMQKLKEMKPKDIDKLQDKFHSLYLHPESYESARLAAGCVLQVVDCVLEGQSRSGVAIVRPPGHHAEPNEPCGFCVFNNVSLAAKYAVNVHGLKRVVLIDWDVHHGNGSQHMFEEDSSVLYISIHRYDNGNFFPSSPDANYNVVGLGNGKGYTVNIPWNKRSMGDGDYMAAFCQVVLPICYQYNPELVLVSAGFDAAIGDPLGGYKVTPEAFGHMTHLLSSLANGRIILSLEGGYNISSISYSMAMCTKALLGDPLPPLQCNLSASPSAVNSIKNVISVQSAYWSSLRFNVALPKENVLPEICVKTENVLNHPDGDNFLSGRTKNIDQLSSLMSHLSVKEINTSNKPTSLGPEYINIKESEIHNSSSPNGEKSLESPLDISADSACIVVSPSNSSIDEDALTLSNSSSTFFDGNNQLENVPPPNLLMCDPVKNVNTLNKQNDLQFISSSLRVASDNNSSGTSSHSSQDKGSSSSSTGKSGSNKCAGGDQSQTLADYLADNMQALVSGEIFAVVPLPGCPHLDRVNEVPENGLNCKDPCAECGSDQENWVCLDCYTVHCGRYINEHMMKHGILTSHPLTLSFADLSVWCYACEAYIDNPVLYAAKNAAHRSKFGSDMPWTFDEHQT